MFKKKIKDKNFFLQNLVFSSKDDSSTVTTFLNPFSYYKLKDDALLYEHIDHMYIDGASLVFMHNLFNKIKVDRVSFDFSSIAYDVINFVSETNDSLLLIGGTKEDSVHARYHMKMMFPNTNINVIDGYRKMEDILDIAQEYRFISLGMGCPLQDKVAVEIKKHFPIGKKIYTCGGFISQTALKGDYYHPIIKKLGLRWLQRMVLHSHVRRRLLNDYPVFFFRYIKENIYER
ncbi:TPA: WecB/TagA/CpsF family glycosyltransferase [Photobacterium damselae]